MFPKDIPSKPLPIGKSAVLGGHLKISFVYKYFGKQSPSRYKKVQFPNAKFIITSSHLHIFTSSHLHIFTSSHLHFIIIHFTASSSTLPHRPSHDLSSSLNPNFRASSILTHTALNSNHLKKVLPNGFIGIQHYLAITMYLSSVAIIITSCLAIIACAAPANNLESPPELTEKGLQKNGNTNAGIGNNHMIERGIFDGKSKKKGGKKDDKKKDKKKDKGKDKDEDGDQNKQSYYKAVTAEEFCGGYTCRTGYDEDCQFITGELLSTEKVTCGRCVQSLDGSFRCSP
ncbi:hypothetical protein B0O99DRAFT_696584 [Bisporella sp. PMI_857]|nr:hypothetical protein B0O99DRAFT_696584 [Bisporella sp. PMI_857]